MADDRWLANRRQTQLWLTPERNLELWIMRLPRVSIVRQLDGEIGAWIEVEYFGSDLAPQTRGWVEARDFTPIGAPSEVPPQESNWNEPPDRGGKWLKNYGGPKSLWSRPVHDVHDIEFTRVPQHSIFAQLVRQEEGRRIACYYYGNRTSAAGVAWVDADGLGPIDEPVPPIVEPEQDEVPPPLPPIPGDIWTLDLGRAISRENYWDPNGQPQRRSAMERCNQLARDRRIAIFETSMDEGLSAEGAFDQRVRESWTGAMRLVVRGGPFEGATIIGECADMNPFMLAGESGGKWRGGADYLNSSALGYFQFLAQKPSGAEYGHWAAYMSDHDRAYMTNPRSQVQQFIRAVRTSRRHKGDPWSVVRQKKENGWWAPLLPRARTPRIEHPWTFSTPS